MGNHIYVLSKDKRFAQCKNCIKGVPLIVGGNYATNLIEAFKTNKEVIDSPEKFIPKELYSENYDYSCPQPRLKEEIK